MKIFENIFFPLLGYCLACILSLLLADVILMFINLNGISYKILIITIYFIIIFLCDKIFIFSLTCACAKYFKISLFLLLLIFWYDYGISFKFSKILSFFIKKEKYTEIQKYFYDNNRKIQFISLLLYAKHCDEKPVIKWFEDNYISKNIPIDSLFHTIYKDLSIFKTS